MAAKDKVKGAIFGVAVGDALGVPVEFQSRTRLKGKPVTGMREYGSHYQPAGTWSDDTAMTLAALDVLNHGLDYEEIMAAFAEWEQNAAYTAGGCVFDMGIACFRALQRYRGGLPALACGGTGERDNGNGSLMRILPAALYCADRMDGASVSEKIAVIHNISSLTHAHDRSRIGCGIYAFVVWRLLEEPSVSSALQGLRDAKAYYESRSEYAEDWKHYSRIMRDDFARLEEDEIFSSGYVVHTLEAALWCLLNTGTYGECVLKAVNLGGDTDTTAVVAGGLAGLLYGYEGIPAEWLGALKKADDIESLCSG